MTDLPFDRRDFVRTAGIAAGGLFVAPSFASTLGRAERELKVGVIGCGGRGTGAAVNALEASPDTRITAMVKAMIMVSTAAWPWR